jgi:hypothetical protein
MLAGCKSLPCLAVLAVACFAPSLPAQIVDVHEYHGKQATCVYSGLIGTARSCGTEGYVRVFTGTVRSTAELGDTDKLLRIVPDEAFVGDSGEAIVITDQACLNKDIKAGDRWLFYLDRDPQSNKLVMSYDGPSKPITEAEDDISMLRDLEHLGDTGLIIGTIELLRGSNNAKPTPIANLEVIAKNIKTGDKYSAYTNERGYFEFRLPVGEYDVNPAPTHGLAEVTGPFSMLKGSIPAEKQRCWEHDFTVKKVSPNR